MPRSYQEGRRILAKDLEVVGPSTQGTDGRWNQLEYQEATPSQSVVVVALGVVDGLVGCLVVAITVRRCFAGVGLHQHQQDGQRCTERIERVLGGCLDRTRPLEWQRNNDLWWYDRAIA